MEVDAGGTGRIAEGHASGCVEMGEVLPDLFHFRILAQFYRVSADSLLELELDSAEHVIETIKVGGAIFEVVKRPETLYAGKIIYAKDYPSIEDFYSSIDTLDSNRRAYVSQNVVAPTLPAYDVTLSVNFWLEEIKETCEIWELFACLCASGKIIKHPRNRVFCTGSSIMFILPGCR